METVKNNKINILIAIGMVVATAVLGSVFVNLGMGWFESLTKPTDWIPSFVIPVVWTIIYLTFAIILFLWLLNDDISKKVVGLLIVNAIFNVLWCLVFFTLNQLFFGNVIIVINALLAIALVFEIMKTKYIYACILSIYPIWLCIASTLNLAVWILN